MSERKLLVVDDEQVLLELVNDCLEGDFSHIDTAINIEQAKKNLLEQHYDCLLIDIDLRGQNGAELVKFLEDDHSNLNSATPIVLMSGHINDDFKKKHSVKFAGILSKPFKKEDLQATVLIALGSTKSTKRKELELEAQAQSTKSKAQSDSQDKELKQAKKIKVEISFNEDTPEIKAGKSIEVDVFDPKVEAPFQVKDIDKKVKKFMMKVKKNPKLRDLFKSINLKSDDPYMMTHIGLLINISTGISMKMEWGSQQTLEKFIFASYLHDLSLGNSHKLAKFSSLQEIEQDSSLTDDEKKLAKFHPQASSKLFEHKKDVPLDVQGIVCQHHERPDGSGFPAGLTHKRITPLSSIFIVSHILVDYIFDNADWKIEEFIKIFKPKLKGPHFRKIFMALQTMK